jgi:folylpolyglutamate synthase
MAAATTTPPALDNYESALAALYSPLHQAVTKEAIEASAARRTRTISDMRTYLHRLHISSSTKQQLQQRIVHITGTKGKGSTACMCEAILRKTYHLNTILFTSPHLVHIRERIRINGRPVSTQCFGQVYWSVRNRLEANAHSLSHDNNNSSPPPLLPGYFRMLTLMAIVLFQTYEPAMDVLILEVGMGGRYDATNLFHHTEYQTVCGVTLLDYDHTRILGETLEEIAWEKGGIFKSQKNSDEPCTNDNELTERTFFALDSNTESVLQVLQTCAIQEGQGTLKLVGAKTATLPKNVALGLHGAHQRDNAELAIALCQELMKNESTAIEPSAIHAALADLTWPGRCQTIQLENAPVPTTLCLDGAHTVESIRSGIQWFLNDDSLSESRVLVFNCSHERSPVDLLELLVRVNFKFVFFSRADSERPSALAKHSAYHILMAAGKQVRDELLPASKASWQETLACVWRHLENEHSIGPSKLHFDRSVAETLEDIKSISARQLKVLVTGSLYLVGSFLSATDWTEEEANGRMVDSFNVM